MLTAGTHVLIVYCFKLVFSLVAYTTIVLHSLVLSSDDVEGVIKYEIRYY